MRSYILHLKNENRLVAEVEAIREAERQKKAGTVPRYVWRDCKTGEHITPPGWLVWSTCADGCGIVYRRSDGKMILATGWQGDFICI